MTVPQQPTVTAVDFPPRGTFRGRNMMTPEIVGYYRIVRGSSTLYAEVSEGTGFSNQPIFGVTFARNGGAKVEVEGEDPSKCVSSLAAAKAHMDYVSGKLWK